MNLENVKQSLDNNKTLTDEVRDNLYSLACILNKQYPNFDLTNLCKAFETVQIKKASKFLNRSVSKYDAVNNIITLNEAKMAEGYDMMHIMMSNVLMMATNNGKQTGFDNGKFHSLNLGYTEMISNLLVGNDSDIGYLTEEYISVNSVGILIGSEVLEQAYFNNNTDLLVEEMRKAKIDIAVYAEKLDAICMQENEELKHQSFIKLKPNQDLVRVATDDQKIEIYSLLSAADPAVKDPIISIYINSDIAKEAANKWLEEGYVPTSSGRTK